MGRQPQQDVCLRRLGEPPKLLEAVSQRCVHSYRDDRSRPGHDAEEPHMQVVARGTEGHVYLWIRFRACQPAVHVPRRAPHLSGTASGHGHSCIGR